MTITIAEILTVLAFFSALLIGPVAMYRIVTAKSRTAYVKNLLLFSFPIGLTFLLNTFTGIFSVATTQVPHPPPPMNSVLEGMSGLHLVVLILVALLWIGGGNYIQYQNRKRNGRTWWQDLNPFNPPLVGLNGQEKRLLVVLFAVCAVLMFIAFINF